MGWLMHVEVWFTATAHGEIVLDDPDRIVEQALFVDLADVEALVADSPLWVRVPLVAWIEGGMRPIGDFSFAVFGVDRSSARVEQLLP
jgi:hypothetical protein